MISLDPNTHHIQKAIGYIRVSTEMQANEGHGLDRQLGKMKNWCEVNGYRMTSIYQDVASAVGDQNLRQRPEFEQAVCDARAAGIPLIVSDVSRVSRDLSTLERLVIDKGLQVISVVDDGEVPVGVLRERVTKASENARRIAEGTCDALSRVVRVKRPETRLARQRAAQESAKVRVSGKFKVLDQVVDFLEANPEVIDKPSRVIADRLNDAGILTNWNNLWTDNAVRSKMKDIREELLFRQEMRREEDMGAPERISAEPVPFEGVFPVIWDDTACAVSNSSNSASVTEKPADTAEINQDEREEAEMRRNPSFGIF